MSRNFPFSKAAGSRELAGQWGESSGVSERERGPDVGVRTVQYGGAGAIGLEWDWERQKRAQHPVWAGVLGGRERASA